MESKDTQTELSDLKRSNAMAIHLYKACEGDLDVLLGLYIEVSELYNKLYEQHNAKVNDTIEQLKKAREERLKISSNSK